MKNPALPGKYIEVSQRFVKAGDVVLLDEEDHLVLRKRVHDTRKFVVTTENIETGRQRQGYFGKDERIYRFKLQNGLPGRWEMACGDVVLYRDERMVAIRHRNGWYASSGRRNLQPDMWILRDVISGRAEPVRHAGLRHATRMQRPYPAGSVAAVADPAVQDPTAWICIEPDLWCSTTRVEASDLMINMELRRDRYSLLYVPTQERTT